MSMRANYNIQEPAFRGVGSVAGPEITEVERELGVSGLKAEKNSQALAQVINGLNAVANLLKNM